MKRIIATLIILGSCLSIQAQQVGQTTVTFNDPTRTGGFGSGGGPGRQIQTEIYYPASTAGVDVPVEVGDYPIVVFGHGFVMAWSAYENIWTDLVANGYIVAFPRTEGSFSPSHEDFGKDLALVVDRLLLLNDDAGSLFNDKLSGKAAIAGHSMGGGATFIAANETTNIQTIIGLAPAETDPSAIAAASNIQLPALVLSGSSDGVTPEGDHHLPIFNALNSTCKYYVSITGGAHCYFANSNFNCDTGETFSSSGISVTRTEQQETSSDYMVPWLNIYLKDECADQLVIDDLVANDTRTVVNAECVLDPDTPTTTANQTICEGELISISVTDGELNSATDWQWYEGSCGGTPISSGTSINVNPTSTNSYFVRGEGGCSTPGACSEIIITVTSGFNETDEASICDGGSYIFGTQTLTTSGVFTEVFTSAGGCDSTVVLTLDVVTEYNETDEATICDGDSYEFGTQTLSSAGVFTEVFSSVSGCDSTVVLTLNLNPIYNETDEATICQGQSFTFPDGTTGNTAQIQTSVLTSSSGCDSIIVTTLTIETIDVSVTQSGETLTANQAGATYQWIDCDNNNEPIIGETGVSFTATNSGNYAVIVTLGGCENTSDCYQVNVVSLEKFDAEQLKVYPNPTKESLNIQWEGMIEGIEIRDAIGRLVYSSKTELINEKIVDVSALETGIYFIHLYHGTGIHIEEIVKH